MVAIWDLGTGKAQSTLKGHAGPVRGIAISPNGELIASASTDGTVKLWELKTGVNTNTFVHSNARVYCVAFHPDGTILAAGGGDYRQKTFGEIKEWVIAGKKRE